MGCFLPSEVARLVLGYLKEQGCRKTEAAFLQESKHLKEYTSLLSVGREYSLCVMGKTLGQILDDYGRIKMEDEKMYANGMSKLWVKITSDGRVLGAPLPTPHVLPITPRTSPGATQDQQRTGQKCANTKNDSSAKRQREHNRQANRTRRQLQALQQRESTAHNAATDTGMVGTSANETQCTARRTSLPVPPVCSADRKSPSKKKSLPSFSQTSPEHCIHRTTAMLTGTNTPCTTITCPTSPHQPNAACSIAAPQPESQPPPSPQRGLQTSAEDAGDHADCSAMDTGFDTSDNTPPSCHSTPVKSPRRIPCSVLAGQSPSFSGAIQRSCHNSPRGQSARFPSVVPSSSVIDSSSTPASPAINTTPALETPAPPLEIPTEPQLPQTPTKLPHSSHSMPPLLCTPAKSIIDSERGSICGKSPRRKAPAPKRRSIGEVMVPKTCSNESTNSSELRSTNEEAISEKMLEELLNNKAWAVKLADRINKANEVKGIVRDTESQKSQEFKVTDVQHQGHLAGKDTSQSPGPGPGASPSTVPVWHDMNTQTGDLLAGDRDLNRNALQDIVDMTCNDPDFDMLFNMFKVDKYSFVEKEYGVPIAGGNSNQMSLSDATASALETLYNDPVASLSGVGPTAASCATTNTVVPSAPGCVPSLVPSVPGCVPSLVPSGGVMPHVSSQADVATSSTLMDAMATLAPPVDAMAILAPPVDTFSGLQGGALLSVSNPIKSNKDVEATYKENVLVNNTAQKVQILHPSQPNGDGGFVETIDALQVVLASPSKVTRQCQNSKTRLTNTAVSSSKATTLHIQANNSPVKIRLPSNSPVRIQLSGRNGQTSSMEIFPAARRLSEQLSDPESITSSEGSEIVRPGRSRIPTRRETGRPRALRNPGGHPCSDSESVCSSEGSGNTGISQGSTGRTHGVKDSRYIKRHYVKRSNTPPSPQKIPVLSSKLLHPHFQDGAQNVQAKEIKTRHASKSGSVLSVPVGKKPVTLKLPNSTAVLNQLLAQLGPGVRVIMPGKQQVSSAPPCEVSDSKPSPAADIQGPPCVNPENQSSPPPSNPSPEEASPAPQASGSVSVTPTSSTSAQHSPALDAGPGRRKPRAKSLSRVTPARGRGGARTRGGRRVGKAHTNIPCEVIDISDLAGMENLIESSRPAVHPVVVEGEDVFELPVTVELDSSMDVATPSPKKIRPRGLSMPDIGGLASPVRALHFSSPKKNSPSPACQKAQTLDIADSVAAIADTNSSSDNTKISHVEGTEQKACIKPADRENSLQADASDTVTASQLSSQPCSQAGVCGEESTILVCSQASLWYSPTCSPGSSLNKSALLLNSQASPRSKRVISSPQPQCSLADTSLTETPQTPASHDVSEYFPLSPSPGPSTMDGGSAAEECLSVDRPAVSQPHSVPMAETESSVLSPCSASMPAPSVHEEPQAPDPAGAAAAPRVGKPKRLVSLTPIVPRQGHAPSAHSTPIPRESTIAASKLRVTESASVPFPLRPSPSAPVSRVPSPTLDKHYSAPSPAMSDTQVSGSARMPRRIRPIEVPHDSNDAPWPPKKAVVRSEGPDTFPLCSPSQDSMSCGSAAVSPTMVTGTKPSATIAGSMKPSRSKTKSKESKKKSKKSLKKSPLKNSPKGKKSKKCNEKKSQEDSGKSGKRSRCNSVDSVEFVNLDIGGCKQMVPLEAMAKAVADLAGTNQGREFLEHLNTKPVSPSSSKEGKSEKTKKKKKQSSQTRKKGTAKDSKADNSKDLDSSHLLSMPNILDIAVNSEDAENIKQLMETGQLPQDVSPQKIPAPQVKVVLPSENPPTKKPRRGGQRKKGIKDLSIPIKRKQDAVECVKEVPDEPAVGSLQTNSDVGNSPSDHPSLSSTAGPGDIVQDQVGSTSNTPDHEKSHVRTLNFGSPEETTSSSSKGFFPVMAKLHSGSASASPQGYNVISKPASSSQQASPMPDPADIDSLLGIPDSRRHHNSHAGSIRTLDLHSTSSNLLFSDSMSRFSGSNLMSESMHCALLQALDSPGPPQKWNLDTPVFKIPAGISPRKPSAAQSSLKRNLSELAPMPLDKPLDLSSPKKSGSGISLVVEEAQNSVVISDTLCKPLKAPESETSATVRNPLSYLVNLVHNNSDITNFAAPQSSKCNMPSVATIHAAKSLCEVGAGKKELPPNKSQHEPALISCASSTAVSGPNLPAAKSTYPAESGKGKRRNRANSKKRNTSNDRSNRINNCIEQCGKLIGMSSEKSDVRQRKNYCESSEVKKKSRSTKSAKTDLRRRKKPEKGSSACTAGRPVPEMARNSEEPTNLTSVIRSPASSGVFVSIPDTRKPSFQTDSRNIQDILREVSNGDKSCMSSTLDLSQRPSSGPKNAYLFSPERLGMSRRQPARDLSSNGVVSPTRENSNSSPDVFPPVHETSFVNKTGSVPRIASPSDTAADSLKTPTWMDESSMPSPFLKRNTTPKFSSSPTAARLQSQSSVSPVRSPLLNRLIKQTSKCMSRSPSVSSANEDALPDIMPAVEGSEATVLKPDYSTASSNPPATSIPVTKKRKRSGENDKDGATSKREKFKLKARKKAKLDNKFQNLDLDKFLKKVHST